jgi:hypothetical protein
MFDRQTTALIRPALNGIARQLACRGISANALTFAGQAVSAGSRQVRSRCRRFGPAPR